MPSALAPGLVELRVVHPATLLSEIDALTGLLSPDEHARAAGYKLEAPRQQFILARGFLRRSLADRLSVDPRLLRFGTTGNEKPVLVDQPSLHFNLSHTSNAIALAVSGDRPVGVDVEQIQMRRSLFAIANQQFHVAERADLEQATPDAKLSVFYRIWTCKEAYLKGLGHGFAQSLTSFAMRPAGERFIAEPELDTQNWSVISLIDQDRAIAVAAPGQWELQFARP